MSPRLFNFVVAARRRGVGREAICLACLMETDGASFAPQIGFPDDENELCTLSAKPSTAFPLVCMARVLEELDTFLRHAKIEAGNILKKFQELQLSVGKLRKAEFLRSKIDPYRRYSKSLLPLEEQ